MFNQKINDLIAFLQAGKILEDVIRFVLILAYAYLITGIFLYAIQRSRDEALLREQENVAKPFLGFTESTIVLGSVSVLFLLFVIIQFRYFFGGQANIGVGGYTYSEYARRGFSELNMVSFFSILLIIGLDIFTRHETERQRRIYLALSVFMVILVVVILVSSYQRLSLAIDWHGYSRLRLYPRAFLIWVGILLVTVVGLQATRLERYFTFAFVLASLGFAATLAFTNVDQAIVFHNVPRYLQGKNLNVAHLSSLSTDAIPALADEFNNSAYPVELHEGIGAILMCYIYSDKVLDDHSTGDWRSLNLSAQRAQQILLSIEPQLSEYEVLKRQFPMIIRTPGNIRYECDGSSAGF